MKIPPEVFESVASELTTYTMQAEEAQPLADLLSHAGPHTASIMESIALIAHMSLTMGGAKVYDSMLNIFLFGVHAGVLCQERIEESATLERLL
jgi:hypothetical protein